jgi:phosphoribosylformylglycinamidine synthase
VKFGIVVFPGSNCDHDAYHVISKHVGQPVDFIWHRDTDLKSYDALIIPAVFPTETICAPEPGAASLR